MHKYHKALKILGYCFLLSVILMLALSIFRKNIYDPKLGANILLIAKNGMGVISIRPGSGFGSILRLPDNLMIPVDINGSSYSVEAIYKFGLPLSNALQTTKLSVGQALGVVISGVVKSDVEFGEAGIREAMVLGSSDTDLSVIDRYMLFKDMGESIRRGSVLTLSLPKNVYNEHDDPDGKSVLRFNPSIFAWGRNQWLVDEVLSETAEVVVINASGIEGRGRLVSRQVESSGVRVVELLSSEKVYDGTCLLFGDPADHKVTFSYLSVAYKCDHRDMDSMSEYFAGDNRGEMVLVIGKQI